MNIRRMSVLFFKDVLHGSRNVIFVMALVLPVVLSLVISLLFGTLFGEQPKLGIYDAGNSAFTADLLTADFMLVTEYESAEALDVAVMNGEVEVGLLLPATFDADVVAGGEVDVMLYVWGQSLVKNRAIIASAITDQFVRQTGHETPITINTILVGDRASLSWQQRLLLLVVLMSVMIGGILVPATSMVEEKRARTLNALTVTPMGISEVFFTKALIGVLLSIFSGFAILTLNGGWGNNPWLLVLVLGLGGIFAASFGVLLGFHIKDLNTLFATIKGMGILLYAPGLIAIFPDTIPQWIAQLFPTYYVMQPVMDISQRGAGFADIMPNLMVLTLLIALMVAGLGMSARRLQTQGI